MSNKVSTIAVVGLTVVCLGLLWNNSQKSAEVVPVLAGESVQNDSGVNEGVTVSSNDQKNFLADEYITSFKLVMKDKNKDVAYKRLNESREKLLALLQKHSVDSKQYEFLSASLKEDWKYTKGKKIFLGYVATQMVSVISPNKLESDSLKFDLTSLAFIDNVSTQSRLKNADSLEVSVIKNACKKASKLASEYAQSVGAKVGKVVSVEGSSGVDDWSSSDSVAVMAVVSSTLSLVGAENSGKSFVRVSQSEDKKFLADKFAVTVNLAFDGPDKENLFRQIGERRNDVARLAKDLGVAESEIDAESMTLRKKRDYEYYNNESRKDAYKAFQKVTVNFTSKDAAVAYLDGLVSLENVEVLAARPVLKNEDSLRVQVTNIAGKKAMARAKAIAEGFDGKLGKVVSVSNQADNLYIHSVLGGGGNGRYNNGALRKARGKSMPGVFFDEILNSPSESGMNIADSVEISAYLEVTAEIR